MKSEQCHQHSYICGSEVFLGASVAGKQQRGQKGEQEVRQDLHLSLRPHCPVSSRSTSLHSLYLVCDDPACLLVYPFVGSLP